MAFVLTTPLNKTPSNLNYWIYHPLHTVQHMLTVHIQYIWPTICFSSTLLYGHVLISPLLPPYTQFTICSPCMFNPYGQLSAAQALSFMGMVCIYGCLDGMTKWNDYWIPVWSAGIVSLGFSSGAWRFITGILLPGNMGNACLSTCLHCLTVWNDYGKIPLRLCRHCLLVGVVINSGPC